MLEILISKGADINAQAFVNQNIQILFLINIIYNISRNFNYKNETPLYYALQNHFKGIGDILKSKGADINTKTIIY